MRRVVTATNTNGESYVVSDGVTPTLFHFRDESDPHEVAAVKVSGIPDDLGARGGLLGELWASDPGEDVDGTEDPIAGFSSWAVNCPPGASRFRTSLFSPGRTTTMHRTQTLDYDFVLSGTVTLILGDGSETELHPGDSVVVPGVDHAWRAGPEGCRLGLVMIGVAGP